MLICYPWYSCSSLHYSANVRLNIFCAYSYTLLFVHTTPCIFKLLIYSNNWHNLCLFNLYTLVVSVSDVWVSLRTVTFQATYFMRWQQFLLALRQKFFYFFLSISSSSLFCHPENTNIGTFSCQDNTNIDKNKNMETFHFYESANTETFSCRKNTNIMASIWDHETYSLSIPTLVLRGSFRFGWKS